MELKDHIEHLPQKEYKYSMVDNGVCEIIDPTSFIKNGIRTNLESAKYVLKNVENSQKDYRTEEDFQNARQRFVGAIMFLENEK